MSTKYEEQLKRNQDIKYIKEQIDKLVVMQVQLLEILAELTNIKGGKKK